MKSGKFLERATCDRMRPLWRILSVFLSRPSRASLETPMGIAPFLLIRLVESGGMEGENEEVDCNGDGVPL